MKTNDNLIGGSLKTDSYLDYANYLADFATYMEENDAPLYGISIQNEPDIQVDYESCDWTANEMTNFLRDHGSIIQAKTKVIAPESFQFIKNFSDIIFADDEATANFDIVGAHIYGGGLSEYVLAAQKGKEVWMTEHLDTEITYPSILATGKEIHDCMTTGSYNAYIWWYLKRFYGPMDEDGTISKRGFMMAQFSKFIRPGYRRKDTKANPKSTLYVSAYQGDKAVIVVLNTGTSAISQQFAFKNGTVTSVTPYTTSETLNLVQGTSIPVSENLTDFTYTIPAMSMVTFVED